MTRLGREDSFYLIRKGDEYRDLRVKWRKSPFRYKTKHDPKDEGTVRGHLSNRKNDDARASTYRKRHDTHDLRSHRDTVGHDDD
jgi:hypothetical protein